MAAETIISTILEVALSEAISIVKNQIQLQWGFKDELKKLQYSLTMTHSFVQDAETRQVHNRSVQDWLKQLREFASKADDVLDELAYEAVRRKMETQMRKKVCNFFSISKNPIVFCFKMPLTVKDLNISLKEINDEAHQFGLQQGVPALPPLPRGSQPTHSFVDLSKVAGREAEVSTIIDLLISSNTRQTFSIISIVGMGGLGKTTLAKSICNNERTKSYFSKIMWVCVSEKFDVDRILQEMFECLTGQTWVLKNRNAMLEKLQNELEGKTYLLVLDDVWDENFNTWDDLRGSLLGMNENKRCSILVTTRNENVAVVRETSHENMYCPRKLMDDECWGIIKSRAFQDSSISPELEDIGKEIARKCGGLPLVANVIGGTMCNKWDINEWVSLRNSSRWGSLEKEGVVGVLKLSFDRLPSSSLKRCFVYCSIFPKDFRMEKEQLIQLWMAEGFLHPTEGNSQLAFEEIGNEYFNNLLSNSLLQDVEKDSLECITGCKMHDFVHDLALSIRNSETSSNTGYGVKLWHSLFLESSFFHMEADFKDLRVLKFCDADISSLSESIGRLKHLRYFDISGSPILRLPKSIARLYLLQTLRLLRCYRIEKLPKGMKNLVSLRHLYIDQVKLIPDEIGCLTSLQTLPIFDVGTKRGRGIGELGCLNELGGELKISNLQNVRNKEDAQGAKIWEKKKLHMLRYEWVFGREVSVRKDDEEVLEGLEPHSNLKSLTIQNYKGESNPSWLVRKSSVSASTPPSAYFQPINLVELKLSFCSMLKSLPTDLGQCPNLKFLHLEGLYGVRCIGNEFYFNNSSGDDDKNNCMTLFPALEKFTFRLMNKLTEWVDVEATIPVFPLLKELGIEYCENLSSLPVMSRLSSLEVLTISSCNELRLIGDGVFPSSLKQLRVGGCRKLGSIPSVEGGISFLQQLFVSGCDELSKIEEGLLASTCLRKVEIEDCPNLISISSIQGCSSLLRLNLNSCGGLTSLPTGLPTCTSLERLTIRYCNELSSIGDGVFPSSLKQLRIEGCRKLGYIPSVEGGISFLQEIRAWGCDELSKIEEGLLASTCLRNVSIYACPNLISISSIQGSSSLLSLNLFECGGLTSLPSGLPTCTSLKTLTIEDCNELSSIGDGVSVFPSSLKQLRIGGCRKLGYIPSVEGGISFLQEIDVWGCDELTKIEEGLLASTCLREVEIKDCPNLISISSIQGCSSLLSLSREECEGLTSLPSGLPTCTSLETLTIVDCNELSSIGDGVSVFPSSLKQLRIIGCRKLGSIPSVEGGISFLQEIDVWRCDELSKIGEGLLASTCLRDVSIKDCPNLISIPSIEGCSSASLQSLKISSCNSLNSIPVERLSIGCLTRLKKLSLGPFSEELEEFPGLTSIHLLNSSLENLRLDGWKKLSSLPHQLQHLTALEGLSIHYFSGVKALPEWFGNLSSLRKLKIRAFVNLEHLPSKEAMQRLSNLQHLSMWDCPKLKKNNAERSKVSHIQYTNFY